MSSTTFEAPEDKKRKRNEFREFHPRHDERTSGFRQAMERSRLREMAIRLPRVCLALECALSRHWNSHLDVGNAKP